MKCSQCGKELTACSVFCDQCGAKVESKSEEIICQCGNKLSPHARFCGECGANVEKKTTPIYQSYVKTENTTIEDNHVNDNKKTRFMPPPAKSAYKDTNYSNYINFYIPTTIWISGLRIVAYIGFFAVIILGIYQWTEFADYGEGGFGFLIFIVCAIVAFLVVASLMVFLDMANDVNQIRKIIEK
ncbi:MAG: zinc ribbon domain-containing protein, partial [Lachnospiraceae bacterium]|nr:zinc ribbon domain-containing protein [Lachnospiraceae bacterium]